MNDHDTQELLHILRKQVEVQKNLLALEESKKNALIEGDTDGLAEIIKQQAPLVLLCSGLEEKREQIIASSGLPKMPFSQMIEQLPAAYDEDFRHTLADLVATLQQLKKTNSLNERILHSRLSRIKQCLSVLGAQDYDLTYDQEGRF